MTGNDSPIDRTQWVCPYCDKPLPDERSAHCGEVGHAVKVASSEISVVAVSVDPLFKMKALRDAIETRHPDLKGRLDVGPILSSYERAIDEPNLKFIREPEPVMVDLESGDRAIAEAYGFRRVLKSDDDLAFKAAKACAEAWGLKWE